MNTIPSAGEASPVDQIGSYQRLAQWLVENDALVEPAAIPGDGGSAVLATAHALRATIHRLLTSSPAQADVHFFNELLARASAQVRLAVDAHGCWLTWSGASDDPAAILWPIVRSAANLLTSPEAKLVKECAGRDCTWLFIDRTKNRCRCFCSSSGCGNRTRVRRHYAAKRAKDADVLSLG